MIENGWKWRNYIIPNCKLQNIRRSSWKRGKSRKRSIFTSIEYNNGNYGKIRTGSPEDPIGDWEQPGLLMCRVVLVCLVAVLFIERA